MGGRRGGETDRELGYREGVEIRRVFCRSGVG